MLQRRYFFVFLILSFLFSAGTARAAETLRLTDGFWENVHDSFTGPNLMLHFAAVGSTAYIISTGLDARVHDGFKDSDTNAALGGSILGSGLGALVVGASFYGYGLKAQSPEAIGAAYVVVQSTVIMLSYASLLKIFTGRPAPRNDSPDSTQDQAEDFRIGLSRGGIDDGWPSGHTSTTVAVLAGLSYYYPDRPWVSWLSVGLSGYMMYAISANENGQFHWFSDVVAGAIMGYAIGSTVGKNIRARVDGKIQETSSFHWLPELSREHIGARFIYEF